MGQEGSAGRPGPRGEIGLPGPPGERGLPGLEVKTKIHINPIHCKLEKGVLTETKNVSGEERFY